MSNYIQMLTVIIPAYNEEKVIQKTIDDIFEWSTTSLLEINLVIINNNSTDSTESILKKNLIFSFLSLSERY